MGNRLRYVAAGLLVVMLPAVVTGSALITTRGSGVTPPAPAVVAPAVHAAVAAARAPDGPGTVDLAIMAEKPAAVAAVRAAIEQAGGEVTGQEHLHLTARVPAGAVGRIAGQPGVAAVGTDQELAPEQAQTAALNQALAPTVAADLAVFNFDAIGVGEFRNQYGVSGQGVKVAVIDSGIDPGHPALQQTRDGRRKLIDWKDFTNEGLVNTTQAVPWGEPFTAPDGRRFGLPPRPAVSSGARFGFWDESAIFGYINHDLDRNGSQVDRFGVLLVDRAVAGRYDTVYVDTNNDASFADETPLSLFAADGSVGRLGRLREGPAAARRVAFAVAELDPAGKFIRLGFDGLGHGTQVAGVLGANSPEGFLGVAPDVQLMALKAIGSTGNGDWFAIKQAIRYAATNGAQVINLSIGGLAGAAARFDSTASEWLNQISRDYGVLIILAADNTGPGLSSGTTLGNPSEVMAIGSYYSAAMWKRDYGYVVPNESVWSQSGMGPRSDGSYLPNVIAPGGSPTTSPLWVDAEGYTSKVGTSIAAPHASGAAALLMEAGRKQGVNFDRLSVKRALELGSRRLTGFGVYEQGYGLIGLDPALVHLRQINSVPALRARSPEGHGGLLARSYAPGNASFLLTNLDKSTTRVGVYASEPWVQPESQLMTLPPDMARQLRVRVQPPAEPGVHSAFLLLSHQDKYGTSLTVPITYVRAIDLAIQPQQSYATAGALEAMRYRRFFFEVKAGQSALNVNTRISLGQSQSALATMQVQVFRPDGQTVHKAEIGARGTGLVSLLSVPQPTEGVWEVVLTALPDTSGEALSANYSLDVASRPGPVAQPLRFVVPAGSTTTHPVRFTNSGEPFTGRVEAAGLTPLADPRRLGIPWRVQLGTASIMEDFTLTEFVSRLRVEIANPLGADVGLVLYYLDPSAGWVMRGQSATAGAGSEVVEITSAPTGRYQAMALIDSSAPNNIQYQYRRQMSIQNFQVTTDDAPRRHERNETWSPAVTISAPSTPGRYGGYLLLRDTEQNQTLHWVPYEVSVGQPELLVEPMVAQLVAGRPGTAVLELRDSRTQAPVDGTVTVNGVRYQSRGGQIAVAVTPAGATLTLDVEADMPQYPFTRKRITLPVRDGWSTHPSGLDTGDDSGTWRRKVQSQLP